MTTLMFNAVINGERVCVLTDLGETLLCTLRSNVGLTGTKQGCNSGDCGACTVLLNGRLVVSCLILAAEIQDARVETVEGLSSRGRLHPLQEAFLEQAALQCGFCTPGLLMSAKALLDQNPNPTEAEIRYWISGNLCRCTGYDKIVRAILQAADTIRDNNVDQP